MTIMGYKQIMEVDVFSSLPIPANTGDVAYADDTKRRYAFNGTTWEVIPNQAEIVANARKGIVNGITVTGVTPYLCKTTTATGGAATLWLTSDGTSAGTAVFSTIYPEGIAINAYGTGNNYQVYNVTVSADKKSITCSVNQMAPAVLGLVSVTSAAVGIDVRGIILGTLITP